MRIGDLYHRIKDATGEGEILGVEATPIYSGQAYRISNYGKLYQAISALLECELLLVDMPQDVGEILENNTNSKALELDSARYNTFVSFVQKVNTKLPIVMAVLFTFTPKQDEYTFNIKLPSDLTRMKDISSFNNRILKIFQQFGISKNNVTVAGFSAGSKWYEIVLENAAWVAPFVISCIQLAFDIHKYKKEAKDSEDVKNNVTIINNYYVGDGEKVTEKDYIDNMAKEKINQGVEESLDKMGNPGNKEKKESVTMLVKATTELVKELDKGTEFHLSLDPPEYIREKEYGSFRIDYDSVPRQIIEQCDNDQVALGVGGRNDSDAQDDDSNDV